VFERNFHGPQLCDVDALQREGPADARAVARRRRYEDPVSLDMGVESGAGQDLERAVDVLHLYDHACRLTAREHGADLALRDALAARQDRNAIADLPAPTPQLTRQEDRAAPVCKGP